MTMSALVIYGFAAWGSLTLGGLAGLLIGVVVSSSGREIGGVQ
jgi:hypothetical protein